MIDFSDQVAIVTGAGRGLGRLYAHELARLGASVVVNDLGTSMAGEGADPQVADAVVDEIRHGGGTAVASYDSVATPEGGDAIVRRAIDEFGHLDAVVANAGIFTTTPFEDLSPIDWQQMLRVHLDGAFFLCQPAYRAMQSQRYGRFVLIASSAGLFGQPSSAHYAAAKAGILGLANVIAIEGDQHGILANTVLPFGSSRMVTETIGEGEQLDAVADFVRAIEPGLVVPIVVFLASARCDVTHQCFSAGAGRFARVFVGLAQGWTSEAGARPNADDVAAHLDEITATEPYTVPTSIFDEVAELLGRLGIEG